MPQFAWVALFAATVSLLLVALVAWRVDLLGDEEETRDCKRTATYRDDNRTMWLYLMETATDADPERLRKFGRELDERLPALECRGGNPVPVSE